MPPLVRTGSAAGWRLSGPPAAGPSMPRRHLPAWLALWLLVATTTLANAAATATAPVPRNVLVLYSNGRLVPGNVDVEAGLQGALASTVERPVQVFTEFLDKPGFQGDAYDRTVTSYLQGKYVEHPPDVILAVARDSLDFVLRKHAELFPGVPVIHAAVFASFPAPIGPLPADVVGVPVDYDIGATIEQALRWHPGARHLYFVTGSTPRDRPWEASGLLPRIRRILSDADPASQRALFRDVEKSARADGLGETVDSWGSDLEMLR